MEDELMRLFGDSKPMQFVKSTMDEGQPIEHKILTGAIRNAQKRVEAHNFGIRKRLLEYDQVMSRQREAVYGLRNRFLIGAPTPPEDLDEYVRGVLEDCAQSLLSRYADEGQDPDHESLHNELAAFQNATLDFKMEELHPKDRQEKIVEFLEKNYKAQASRIGEIFPKIARWMILNLIDENWRQHLYALDELQDVIGWRAYAGRDPILEFKKESFIIFQEMRGRIESQVIDYLVKPQLKLTTEHQPPERSSARRPQQLSYRHDQAIPNLTSNVTANGEPSAQAERPKAPPRRVQQKVGRNDPCPCGSGKKYKHCHGMTEETAAN
jgi:preprotein translocase subunit SecA